MQGHARKAKQLQHAAGHETDDRPDNGPSTQLDNGNMQQAAQRLGPLDLVDKNKKCRRGGCMQHLVFARDEQGRKGQDEPVQFGKNTARCNVGTCCVRPKRVTRESLLKWILQRLLQPPNASHMKWERLNYERQIKFW